MPLTETVGDILRDPFTVRFHWANCVSHEAKGFSHVFFETFPHANCYPSRAERGRDKPGTLCAVGNGSPEQPFIVSFFAQTYPGPSKWDNDSNEKRLEWFRQGLEQLTQVPLFRYPETTVGIPYHMCGSELWPQVYEVLQAWANLMPCQVVVVRWEQFQHA